MLPYISNIQIKLRVYYIGFIYRKYSFYVAFPIYFTVLFSLHPVRMCQD